MLQVVSVKVQPLIARLPSGDSKHRGCVVHCVTHVSVVRRGRLTPSFSCQSTYGQIHTHYCLPPLIVLQLSLKRSPHASHVGLHFPCQMLCFSKARQNFMLYVLESYAQQNEASDRIGWLRSTRYSNLHFMFRFAATPHWCWRWATTCSSESLLGLISAAHLHTGQTYDRWQTY